MGVTIPLFKLISVFPNYRKQSFPNGYKQFSEFMHRDDLEIENYSMRLHMEGFSKQAGLYILPFLTLPRQT